MFYLLKEYWDFLVLALAIGIAIGWWSESARANNVKPDAQPKTEAGT